jgi:hypothetical protein
VERRAEAAGIGQHIHTCRRAQHLARRRGLQHGLANWLAVGAVRADELHAAGGNRAEGNPRDRRGVCGGRRQTPESRVGQQRGSRRDAPGIRECAIQLGAAVRLRQHTAIGQLEIIGLAAVGAQHPRTDPGPFAAPSPTELSRCEPWSVMASVCLVAQVSRKLPGDISWSWPPANVCVGSAAVNAVSGVRTRMVLGVGLPMVFLPIPAASYDGVPSGKTDQASALMNAARNTGGSIGISIVCNVLAHREQFHQGRLVEHAIPSSVQYQETL